MTRLAKRAVDKMVGFTEETGQPIDFHQPDSMNIARNDEIVAMLANSAAWEMSLGLDIDLISPDEAHERMPFLETKGVLAATHMRTDVFLEPDQIALGEELARWIVEGRPPVDLSRMAPARFAGYVDEQAFIDAARIRYAHYYYPPPVLPVAY